MGQVLEELGNLLPFILLSCGTLFYNKEKDTIMNIKEEFVKKLLEIAAECCSYTNPDGTKSITPDDIVSKERISDNVNLTRMIFVRQMKALGFTTETVAQIIGRTESTVRDMILKGGDAEKTSFAYRISSEEVKKKCALIDM